MQSTAFRWPVPERSSPQRALEIGQTLDGAGVGIWATLKNFKGLRSGTKKGNTGFVNDVLEASTNGGLLGVLKTPAPVGMFQCRAIAGRPENALVGFGSGNPVGRFIAKTGGVAGQILSGIAGPNGLDLGGMAGGVKISSVQERRSLEMGCPMHGRLSASPKWVLPSSVSAARWRVQHPKSAAAL